MYSFVTTAVSTLANLLNCKPLRIPELAFSTNNNSTMLLGNPLCTFAHNVILKFC